MFIVDVSASTEAFVETVCLICLCIVFSFFILILSLIQATFKTCILVQWNIV